MTADGRLLDKGRSDQVWDMYEKFEKYMERFQERGDKDQSVRMVRGEAGDGASCLVHRSRQGTECGKVWATVVGRVPVPVPHPSPIVAGV
jgi:hypothetical protein